MEEAAMYTQKKYRVRNGFIRLLKYIEWKELCRDDNQEVKYILDYAIKQQLDRILKGELNILEGKVQIKKKPREHREITLEKETHKLVVKLHKEINCYKGELLEICLYCYALENLTIKEIKLNRLNEWSIEIRNNEVYCK